MMETCSDRYFVMSQIHTLMKYRNTSYTLKATSNIQGDSEGKVNILGVDVYQPF